MSTVIRVEHLSKQYRLGMIGGATLREDLSRWWALKRGKDDPLATVGTGAGQPARIGERFWALKDVSFEVKQGEILGIIGRNGAGKSTLLKILSRITAPTEGVVKVKGRIGSLLEVGTGFHPELTGRENIYLNGAILGMSRREVDRKLDEIIAFSEVEQFIDTPVKRYSSGMYVRLAFAVAAHLDPEILIVDEVLAVGDAAFQKKCLGKMGDVAGEGRTVLFVSHNMASMLNLGTRVIWLHAGAVRGGGPPDEVVAAYLDLLDRRGAELCTSLGGPEAPTVTEGPRLHIEDAEGQRVTSVACGDPLRIVVALPEGLAGVCTSVAVGVHSEMGEKLLHLASNTMHLGGSGALSPRGFVCVVPKWPLNVGSYRLNLALACNGGASYHGEAVATLRVRPGDYYGTGWLPSQQQSPYLADAHWEVLAEACCTPIGSQEA